MKVFSRKSIAFTTLMGGPITAGIMLSHNFKQFENFKSSRNVLIGSIVFTLVLFGLLFQVPEKFADKIPNFVFPLIFVMIAEIIYSKYQKKTIEEYLESGGQKESYWIAFRNTIIGMISIMAIIAVFVYSSSPFEGELFSYGPYGHEIYHDESIDISEVQEIGRALEDFGYFDTSERQTVKLMEENDTYVLYLYVPQSWWDDTDILESLTTLKMSFSNYKISKVVRIKMIDNTITDTIEKEIQ